MEHIAALPSKDVKYARPLAGTDSDLLHFPCAEDALAEIASEEAGAVWSVEAMPRVWTEALAEEYARPN
jgi:hypothetical protein